jgi:hypothetical protein
MSLQGLGLSLFLLFPALLPLTQEAAQIDFSDGFGGALKTAMQLDLATDLLG